MTCKTAEYPALNIIIQCHDFHLTLEKQNTVGVIVGVAFAIFIIITITLVFGYIVWR